MTSPFKLHCLNCGLSLPDAAKYLDVKESRAKEWWMGRRNAPDGVITDLRTLADLQRREAVSVACGELSADNVSDAVNRRLIDGEYNEAH